MNGEPIANIRSTQLNWHLFITEDKRSQIQISYLQIVLQYLLKKWWTNTSQLGDKMVGPLKNKKYVRINNYFT